MIIVVPEYWYFFAILYATHIGHEKTSKLSTFSKCLTLTMYIQSLCWTLGLQWWTGDIYKPSLECQETSIEKVEF